MEIVRLNPSVEIDSSAENVWKIMLTEETYKLWTKPFSPTDSWYEGVWQKGEKIKFLSKFENNIMGMIMEIVELREYEEIRAKFIGEIYNGEVVIKEIPEGEKGPDSYENYFFKQISENKMILEVQQDCSIALQEYLDAAWPKAFEILKKICEK